MMQVWEYMERRARSAAEYILETNATVRACAEHFGTSKSTVHKDVTERLAEVDPQLYAACTSGICAAANRRNGNSRKSAPRPRGRSRKEGSALFRKGRFVRTAEGGGKAARAFARAANL